MYYRICPDCGVFLDPGEICECKKYKASEMTRNDKENAAETHKAAPEKCTVVIQGVGA